MSALPSTLRPLAGGTLLTSVGSGAWYTSWALFFTRAAGLSAAQAGVTLAVGGAVGLASATPLGHLADRLGARDVLAALVAAQGVGTAGYLVARGVWPAVAAACVTLGAARAAGGVRTALIARLCDGEQRLAALAGLRVVSHVGFAIGAGIGALVIQLDKWGAYAALIAFNAATYLAYAGVILRLPRVPGARLDADAPRLEVLRDAPYLTLAGICGVLTLCWGLLSTGLPLWIAGRTDAPRALSGVIVLVTSLVIAALQVRCTRAASRPLDAARAATWAGGALALSCALFALAAGPPEWGACALLVAGGAAHVTGELLFVAASWGLSVPLMPDRLAGQYQGAFATAEAAAQTASPALITALVTGWGAGGWAVLGALFVVATLPSPAVTRWALATRTRLMATP